MRNQYVIEKTDAIRSSPERIFSTLIAVEKWSQWTKSVSKARYINSKLCEFGVQIKIYQPKLPPAVWIVQEITKNRSLVWVKRSFGLKMTANHFIIGSGKEQTVKLQIVYEGFLAGFFYKLTSKLTEKYLSMEVAGLKQVCEA